jgi:hypothetical protein
MRLMSFALTKRQVIDGSKTVTRRNGWVWLVEACSRGETPRLWAVDKCTGFRPGEKPVRYGIIEVVDARREPLNAITKEDCVREGFPDMEPREFVEFYRKVNKCEADKLITRTEFRQVGEWVQAEADTRPLSLTLESEAWKNLFRCLTGVA